MDRLLTHYSFVSPLACSKYTHMAWDRVGLYYIQIFKFSYQFPHQQFNFFTLPRDVARDLDKTTSSVSVHIMKMEYYIEKQFK